MVSWVTETYDLTLWFRHLAFRRFSPKISTENVKIWIYTFTCKTFSAEHFPMHYTTEGIGTKKAHSYIHIFKVQCIFSISGCSLHDLDVSKFSKVTTLLI